MSQPRRRILSIDGGGIYGLTSARWLRMLCERDRSFLDGKDIFLFAGCSSGAVNSLLLARREVPREAVLSGELERFWQDPGTFSNSDPWGQLLSWMELSGWYGEKDFMDLLLRHFGDITLGDLPHRVLISTFNWSGAPPKFPPIDPPAKPGDPPTSHAAHAERFQALLKDLQEIRELAGKDVRSGEPPRRWHPHMFSNQADSRDRAYRVADIAYGAATPPGFRALRGGIGDGASFSASPSVDAIAHVVGEERCRHEGRKGQRVVVHDVLDSISLLSLGDGTYSPFHSLPNSNLGLNTWGVVPTNPMLGVFWGPSSFSLQPADQSATLIASELLGDDFFRLNPSINDVPTVPAAYYAKWPSYRTWILKKIADGTESPLSRSRVDAALRFLGSEDWLDQRETRSV